MYKDLMVPITAAPGDSDAVNAGITLAAAFDAHLRVVEIVNVPTPIGDPWALSPDVAVAEVYNRLHAQGEANAARLRSRLEKESVSSEVELMECFFTEPERMLAHRAHYVDLAIVAGSVGDAEATAKQAYFGGLLLQSGRPVLVIPPRCKTLLPPKRIVMAWRPTREAARAVHDALPFLRLADQVDVLVVNAAIGEMHHGEQPGADIATHLARHGVKVNVVLRDAKTRPTSSIVLEHARETLAHMIVVGGYGHSRFREWAMGGVTRELLSSAPIPVLYSH